MTLQSVSEGTSDLAATTATIGRVLVGESATGEIGSLIDHDWFRVYLEADTAYQIDLEGAATSKGTLVDPWLSGIRDAEGNDIDDTSNDDIDPDNNLNSRVTFTPTTTATYFIEAFEAGSSLTGIGTYTVSVTRAEAEDSDDATLSALTLSDGTLRPTFSSETTEYHAAVLHEVEQVTITYTAASGSSVEFMTDLDAPLPDADTETEGQQVNVRVGTTGIVIRVTAEDGMTTEDYAVTVERNSPWFRGWTPTRDFNTLAGGEPRGMWSDGTTLWIADDSEDKLHAYTLATQARDSAQDIALHTDNTDPWGIWSDETTIWVVDTADKKLYAYALADGTRQDGMNGMTNQEFGLHTDNDNPYGIWSNESTIWVADEDYNTYAYTLSNGSRDSDKDLGTFPTYHLGLWSDGITIWGTGGAVVFAYTLADGARQSTKDTAHYTPTGTIDGILNGQPKGIWSDGQSLWVADSEDDKLYAYTLLSEAGTAGSNTLSGISLSAGTLQPEFDYKTGIYLAPVTFTNHRVTVTPTRHDTNKASVEFLDRLEEPLEDADTETDGQQVDLDVGNTIVNLRVTADDALTLTYTVQILRDQDTFYGRRYTEDIALAGLNSDGRGIWGNDSTIWVVDEFDAILYAYARSDGSRDSAKDITLHTENGRPWGIWSNGTTVWVTDIDDKRLYAYALEGGTRQDGTGSTTNKEFALHTDNAIAHGIWSDDTTIWVVDGDDRKAYSYTLSGGAHDPDKDITLDGGVGLHAGIWGNGATIWVVYAFESRTVAYTQSDSSRDPSKEFLLPVRFPDINGSGPTGRRCGSWTATWTYSMPCPYPRRPPATPR